MGRQPTGNPVGRPPKDINWEQFEQLCAMQCTKDEICSFLHIGWATLDRHLQAKYGENFEETYKKLSASGKISLRRAQFRTAMEGNCAMQIWLGKQVLKQREPDQDEIKKYSKGIYENVTSLIKKQNDDPGALSKTG